MTIEPSWQLLIALVLLTALPILVAKLSQLKLGKGMLVAALRAALQLTVVSGIIVACLQHIASALAFVVLMFGIAVYTTTGRVGTRRIWWWTAVAMLCGVLPVLAIIYLSGTAPFNGFSIIPISGIIIGNVMNSHTLFGRRIFAALRDEYPAYEGALALGFTRAQAIELIVTPVAPEPLVPQIDSVRTVGLVTLPGAYIGVLLGGGSAIQAGAAQLLVLLGILAGKTLQVAAATRLVMAAKLVPKDLLAKLHQ